MLFTATVSHAMILQVEPFSECDETKICFVPKLRARFEASSSRTQTMKTVSSSPVTTNGCKVSKYPVRPGNSIVAPIANHGGVKHW